MENTNIASEMFSYVFGPPPVVPNETSGAYFQRFQDAFRWQFGVASFKENFKPRNVGELRIQFHLSSSGSVNDIIVLTNSLDNKAETVCKLALLPRAYEPWPKEMCQTQFAGYFTVRTLMLCDYKTNFPPDFDSAIGLSRLTGTYPTNLTTNGVAHFEADPEYLTAGIRQMGTTNYAEAIIEFSKAIEWDSEDAWAYSGLGYCLGEVKDFDGARTNLSRALGLDPQNQGAWEGLSLVNIHSKDYAGATNDASKAIALNPASAKAYFNRAYAEEGLQDFSGALADSEQCVRLAPTNASAFYRRSHVRYCLSDYMNALSDCNKAIELNPRDASAYVLRGDIQQAQHSSSLALESFQKALEIDPILYYARFKAWVLRCESGDVEVATKELKLIFGSRPKQQSAEWSYQLEAFLAGSISEADFLNTASTSATTPQERREHQCEANYYAGVKRLIAGDKKSAADFFQRCIATGVGNFGEYIHARDELKMLQNGASASI